MNKRNTTTTIIDAIRHKQLFGGLPAFASLDSWTAWLTWLKSVFALPMDDSERAIFQQCTGRENPPTVEPVEIYSIVGRRGGKSFLSALTAVFMGSFRSYREYLNSGERATILVLARDRAQAATVFAYIRGIIESIEPLHQLVVAERAQEIELDNHVVLTVRTSDYRSVRGVTLACVIADELCFWDEQGISPDKAIFEALRPALATIPNSKILAISTPYAQSGQMFEMHRQYYGKNDPHTLVWVAPTRVMNPTISQSIIDRAIEKDPEAGQSEWQAKFRTDLESAFSLEAIEACVIRGRDEMPSSPIIQYRGFCDPSGGRNDAFTLCIAHDEDTKVVVDVARAWPAPFDPSVIVAEASELLKGYGILNIVGDNYGGEWPVTQFRANGVSYERCEKSKSELYLAMIPVVNAHNIELPDNRKLIDELRRLERRRARTGRDIIDHPARGSDDLSNATAGACWLLTNTDKNTTRHAFNPAMHIARGNLRFVPGAWPLLVGVSGDDVYAASVIAQAYQSEIRVFFAAVTQGMSLRHHLEQFTRPWLEKNSPPLQLFGSYEDSKDIETRAKLHQATTKVLQGEWCSIWHRWEARLDQMRDALTKSAVYTFKPLIQFSPQNTSLLTQALNSGRYRDREVDRKNFHIVSAFTLLLARQEIWKQAPRDEKPQRVPPSFMSA